MFPLSAFWKTRNKEARKGRFTKCKACGKKWQKENYKVKGRNKRLEKLYGITLEQYDAMFEAQGKVCAICGAKDPRRSGRFIVDHCHKTGRVRGLLCHPCNTLLGMADDDKDTLLSAAKYLEEN